MRYNQNHKKRGTHYVTELLPNLRRRLFVSMRKKDGLTKASPLSMAYQKPASPSGAANSAKNAKRKPKPILMPRMKWNL